MLGWFESIFYALIAVIFLLVLTRLLLLVFSKIESSRDSVPHISLFGKMIFLAVYTLAVKDHLQNKIVYATIVLLGIIYSMIFIIIKLLKN
jgi:hypothetical protein